MQCVIFNLDNEFLVHLCFKSSEISALFESRIDEGRIVKIDGQWSMRLDKGQPHIPTQDHFHILQRGNNFLSINIDGSSHDNSKGRIPNKVRDFLTANYPNFKIPANGILESAGFESRTPSLKALMSPIFDGDDYGEYLIVKTKNETVRVLISLNRDELKQI